MRHWAKKLVVLAAALGVMVGAEAAVAGQATTTRIEPRPFYGAVITIEEGVRVFRPLPRTGHVIINPGHKTPLNLTIEQRREVSRSHHSYYAAGGHDSESGYAGYGSYGGGLPAYGRDGGERGFGRGHAGGVGVHAFRGYRAVKGHGHAPRGRRGARSSGGKRG